MLVNFLSIVISLVTLVHSHPIFESDISQSGLFKRDVNGSSNSTGFSNSSTVPLDPGLNLTAAYGKPFALFKPKVFIISMFEYEQGPWIKNLHMVYNISVPGLSPLYPEVHCVSNFTICQFTTGEAEINAASSVMALLSSPLFDFSSTYFMVAGIAGGEPTQVTIGSATFPKFAVQVGLAYLIDEKEIPSKYHWAQGYFPFGTDNPLDYPTTFYGTEVFELNENLRNRAVSLAKTAKLSNGTTANQKYRELYPYAPANQPPTVASCDTLCSDTYWTGEILSAYFTNLTEILTNGTGTYCSTQQEDNASLEVFIRMAKFGIVDYSRVVILRTISDFARPPPVYSNDTVYFFNDSYQGGSQVAVDNIYLAGLPFIKDVIKNWDTLYSTNYFKPFNYQGDVFNTLENLGGKIDIGPTTNNVQ